MWQPEGQDAPLLLSEPSLFLSSPPSLWLGVETGAADEVELDDSLGFSAILFSSGGELLLPF